MFNITEIAENLNSLSINYKISELQNIRKTIKELSRTPGSDIFTEKTISKDNTWAFHYGGRKELQFNIGIEDEGFRFGVAFSLEPSHSLPDVSVLYPKIFKFNSFVREHVSKFNKYSMWHYYCSDRSNISNVQEIDESLIKEHTFIFIGTIIQRIDYDFILQTFDDLLELYIFVENDSLVDNDEIIHKPDNSFVFNPSRKGLVTQRSYSSIEKAISVDVRHSILQQKLYTDLVLMHGSSKVSLENSVNGKSIDIVLKIDSGYWFYEIKTNSSAKECIRAAMGQVMEYAFWPGITNAEKLIIAGEFPIDDKTNNYLKYIRNKFSLPIEYLQIVFE